MARKPAHVHLVDDRPRLPSFGKGRPLPSRRCGDPTTTLFIAVAAVLSPVPVGRAAAVVLRARRTARPYGSSSTLGRIEALAVRRIDGPLTR